MYMHLLNIFVYTYTILVLIHFSDGFCLKVNRVDILKREVGLLREVKHPNIIELVDMYEDEKFLHLGKHPFEILMNYCCLFV